MTHDRIALFAQALTQLEAALATPADSDLVRAGCIQYFEFCFELAWKCIKGAAADHGVECHSPKACLKVAFAEGWVAEETAWLGMLDDRNRMAHTYSAADAKQIYLRLSSYLEPMRQLRDALQKL